MKNTGLLLLGLASSFCISFAGMLPNGNFEISPSPTKLSGTRVGSMYGVPKWVSRGYVEYITAGAKQDDMVLVVPEGKHAVKLGNGASISQRVRAQKDKFYALTFSFARTCSQDENLNITVTANHKWNDSGILPLQTIYSSVGYDTYSWGFRANADVIEITLHNPVQPGEDISCGPIIDTVALAILDPVKPTGANLVKNGDFGQGPYVFHDTATGVLIPSNLEDDQCPLLGWMVESLKAVKYIDNLHFVVPEGKRAVELVGGKESALAQKIRTTPGESYILTFLVGDAGNGCAGPLAIEAFAGKEKTRIDYNSIGKGGSVKGVLRFKAEKSRTRIRFLSTYYTMTTEGSMCGPVLDDVKVLTGSYHSRIHS